MLFFIQYSCTNILLKYESYLQMLHCRLFVCVRAGAGGSERNNTVILGSGIQIVKYVGIDRGY